IAAAAIPALALGVLNLTAADSRESWSGVAASFVTGAYASLISTARPGGTAMVLFAFAIGSAIIGMAALHTPPTPPGRADQNGRPPIAPQPVAHGEPALADDTLAVNPEMTWLRTRPWLRWLGITWTGRFDARAADAAWGGAAFALPGAVAAATAALAPP